jgi:nitric oxide reductase NorD protein
MEEKVGEIWHCLITRVASRSHPQAAVHLDLVAGTVAILFRALGGDGGLSVEAADATAYRGRRSLLQRIAGMGERVELAWRDERSLRLPPVIDCFPEAGLNRDLYLWLAALASGADGITGTWFQRNQTMAARTLQRFPGLRERYRRLVAAHLCQRPDPQGMPAAEARQELAVRDALERPGEVQAPPPCGRPPHPVPLWLHPDPPLARETTSKQADGARSDRDGKVAELEVRRRRRGERVEMPEKDQGLVTIRVENILTFGEHVKVHRGTDDEDDLEQARSAAEDLEHIAVAPRDRKASGARLKFDLDLPAESEDDLVLFDGILLPEWDWKRARLRPNHCRIVSMQAAQAAPCELPQHLRRIAKRLRNQFQALAPARVWHRAQPDGQEVDLEAYLRFAADRTAGRGVAADDLYREIRSGARDLACLLLADLSLSTDTWIDDRSRVLDVIRDSLFLFAESLAATGDRFGIFGFSSRRRDPVRTHTLKGFDEAYGAPVRGRIQAVKPGYYTRMGAGIRHASNLLAEQPGERRLLLVLSDGKPNDLDQYEGRYGIEDTRHAVRAARRLGLEPFCVTIDERGNEYLPHLFGNSGYVVIRRPSELPSCLPMLYARLTA